MFADATATRHTGISSVGAGAMWENMSVLSCQPVLSTPFDLPSHQSPTMDFNFLLWTDYVHI